MNFWKSPCAESGLLASSNFDFKALALREAAKYSKSKMVSLAGHLAEGVKPEHYQELGKAGDTCTAS